MTVLGVDAIAPQIGLRKFCDVVAPVAVLGPRGILRGQALAAGLYREREVVDLCAGIVVIKLAGDVPAGR